MSKKFLSVMVLLLFAGLAACSPSSASEDGASVDAAAAEFLATGP